MKAKTSFGLGWVLVVGLSCGVCAEEEPSLVGVWRFDVELAYAHAQEEAAAEGRELPPMEEYLGGVPLPTWTLRFEADGTYLFSDGDPHEREAVAEWSEWSLSEDEDGVLTLTMGRQDEQHRLEWIDADHVVLWRANPEDRIFLERHLPEDE